MGWLLDLFETLPIDVCIEDIAEGRYNLQLVIDWQCLSWDFKEESSGDICDLCVIEALIHNEHTNVIAEYDEDQNIIILTATWGGGWGGEVHVWQSIFVSDETGNDGTWVRERMDLPFKTIEAARAAWQVGDTIFVYPGTYNLSWVIDTPSADDFRIHCFSGVHIIWFPELPVFHIRAGFRLTGDATIEAQGVGLWLFWAFQIPPAWSAWDVFIEAESILSSDYVILTAASGPVKNIYLKTKLWARSTANAIRLAWSYNIDVEWKLQWALAFEHQWGWLARFKDAYVISTGVSQPAYTQLSLSQMETRDTKFVALWAPAYAIDTNIGSSISVYNSYANLWVNPAIVQLVDTITVDGNVL